MMSFQVATINTHSNTTLFLSITQVTEHQRAFVSSLVCDFHSTCVALSYFRLSGEQCLRFSGLHFGHWLGRLPFIFRWIHCFHWITSKRTLLHVPLILQITLGTPSMSNMRHVSITNDTIPVLFTLIGETETKTWRVGWFFWRLRDSPAVRRQLFAVGVGSDWKFACGASGMFVSWRFVSWMLIVCWMLITCWSWLTTHWSWLNRFIQLTTCWRLAWTLSHSIDFLLLKVDQLSKLIE